MVISEDDDLIYTVLAVEQMEAIRHQALGEIARVCGDLAMGQDVARERYEPSEHHPAGQGEPVALPRGAADLLHDAEVARAGSEVVLVLGRACGTLCRARACM